MSKLNTILLLLLISCSISSSKKCSEIKTLLSELTKLRDSTSIAAEKKIALLPEYESRLKECNGHFDSTHSLALRRMGDIYDSASEFEKAIELYQRSVALIEAHFNDPSVKPKDLITSYYKISLFNNSLNRIAERMIALDSCAIIAIRLKSVDHYALYAMYTIMEHTFHTGDYHYCKNLSDNCARAAMDFAKEGNEKQKRTGIHYAKSSLEWQVNALLVLKDVSEAKKVLETKVTEFSNLAEPGDLGFVYGMLGDVLLQEKNYDKALDYYTQSFELLAQDSSQASNCKATLSLIGYEIYFKHLHDEKNALRYFQKALSYPIPSKEEDDPIETLSINNRIGELFLSDGKYDSALQYFQRAFDQIRPGMSETALLQSSFENILKGKKRSQIANLIFNKAETYRQKYKVTKDFKDLNRAIEVFKVEDQLLEKIKSDQSDAKSKLFWLSDRRKLYEFAIDACNATGNVKDAFYFFERSRAVLLYDQLREQKLLNEEDLKTQALLKKEVAELDKKLDEAKLDSSKTSQIQRQLVMSKKELDKIDGKFKYKNPVYQQGYFEVGSDLLNTVQQKLTDDKAQLVEFFDGDSAVYLMTISPAHLSLQKFDKLDFNRRVDEFVKYLSNSQLLNNDFNGFVRTSNEFYKLIFEKNLSQSGKIIISPDSRYFPVEALLTNSSSANPNYFIQTHTVSYSHSARLFVSHKDSTYEDASANFFGIAPVNFNSNLRQVSLLGSNKSLKNLETTIGGGVTRTFARATKKNFLREYANYEIIQLYTHASDGAGKEEPRIYFSDSILYLSDLINERKPSTRLVVLSACETGTGKWYGGEGVFSFNRGFAAIGIPSSITNLWSVENKATYRLTELFYKYMKQGLDIDVALQKAKLEFIKTGTREEQMPYYWASTVLAGNTEPIVLKNSHSWDAIFWIVAAIVSGLIMTITWLNYKQAQLSLRERQISVYSFS